MTLSLHPAIRPRRGSVLPDGETPRAARPPAKRLSNPLVPTIFHEPWWLEAASRGRYREAEFVAGGKLVGRLPYLPSKQFGMNVIVMPMLTHFLGPAIDDGAGSDATRLLKRLSITAELIALLPNAANTWVKLHRGMAETVAFQKAGFSTTVQFTSEILPAPEEVLWRGMRDKARNVIRRAAERLRVVEEPDADRFLALYEKNLLLRGFINHYDEAVCRNLIEECQRRRVGRILLAVDDDNNISAGIFTVWDERAEFYLMSSRRPASANGATSLLIWTAIRHAALQGILFDFDGARHDRDVRLFVGLGGTLQPRYWVYRTSTLFRAVEFLTSRMRIPRRSEEY